MKVKSKWAQWHKNEDRIISQENLRNRIINRPLLKVGPKRKRHNTIKIAKWIKCHQEVKNEEKVQSCNEKEPDCNGQQEMKNKEKVQSCNEKELNCTGQREDKEKVQSCNEDEEEYKLLETLGPTFS